MSTPVHVRFLVLIGVMALVVSLLPSLARAQTDSNNRALTLSGASNTAVAIAWSGLSFPQAAVDAGDGPTEVILGRDDLFADNLASGSLQGGTATGRPLLLTDSATLSRDTAAELERLDGGDTISTVYLLGGNDAISPTIEAQLMTAGYTVVRLQGETRIETAIDVAEETFDQQAPGGVIYLARAFEGADATQGFADSIALGGWAANNGVPILLTQTSELNTNTKDYIAGNAAITKVEIIGGTSAVSAAVESELQSMNVEVIRIAGDNRFETATEIAAARGFDSADGAEISIVVDGQDVDAWADGFAAARTSGLTDDDGGYPIVLSNGDMLPPETQAFLGDGSSSTTAGSSFAAHLTDVVMICGPTVSSAACDDAADRRDATTEPFPAGSGGNGVGDFLVSPQDDATLAPIAGMEDPTGVSGDPAESDDRTFTATGLDPMQAYRITLVLEENVTISGSEATFADADSNGIADPGASEEVALITMVNGGAPENPDAKTTPGPMDDPNMPTGEFPDADGDLSITIDGEGEGAVYAVFYVNQGASTLLEIDSSGAPMEAYAVSGLTTYDEDAMGGGGMGGGGMDGGVGDLNVTPQDAATLTATPGTQDDPLSGVPILGSPDSTDDNREFTVDGLDPMQAYRITLVLEENVTISGSDATFADADSNMIADPGASEEVALITMVNGAAPMNPDSKTTPSPDDDPDMPTGEFPDADGTLTVTIDGEGAGGVYVVVYRNGGSSTLLEIDASGAPVESYGVSGLTTYEE